MEGQARTTIINSYNTYNQTIVVNISSCPDGRQPIQDVTSRTTVPRLPAGGATLSELPAAGKCRSRFYDPQMETDDEEDCDSTSVAILQPTFSSLKDEALQALSESQYNMAVATSTKVQREHFPSLLPVEALAIHLYTWNQLYKSVNNSLKAYYKTGDLQVLRWLHFARHLQTALMKLQKVGPKPPNILYRYTNLSRAELDQLQTSWKRQLYPSFTSTSEIPLPDFGKIFHRVHFRSAVSIAKLSKYPGEREWLLPAFTPFWFVHSEDNDDELMVQRSRISKRNVSMEEPVHCLVALKNKKQQLP